MNILKFTKWRALLSGMLLALIVGFLYGKGSASQTVLIVLSIAAVLHISLFYYLLIREIKNEKETTKSSIKE